MSGNETDTRDTEYIEAFKKLIAKRKDIRSKLEDLMGDYEILKPHLPVSEQCKEEIQHMITRAIKKILLAIILIFCFSGVARAENWVLWSRTNCLSDFKWEAIDSFTSNEKCKQMQKIQCEKMLLPSKGVTTENGCPSFVMYFYTNGTFCESDFVCLPDTIDPRK